MLARRYRLSEDFVASDVVRWHNTATIGDTVVIALPSHPSVRLHRRPNDHVYWCTEGARGLTVTLEDAQQRLAMFQMAY